MMNRHLPMSQRRSSARHYRKNWSWIAFSPSFAQALAVQQNSAALDPIENIVPGGVGFILFALLWC